MNCAKHVGEIHDRAKYRPCSGRALFMVTAPGGIKWPACVKHVLEARQLGCAISWCDDDAAECERKEQP